MSSAFCRRPRYVTTRRTRRVKRIGKNRYVGQQTGMRSLLQLLAAISVRRASSIGPMVAVREEPTGWNAGGLYIFSKSSEAEFMQ
jgi:hypothetical protein